MDHETEYNGIVDEHYDLSCSTCGRHLRIPVNGGRWIYVNKGDFFAIHKWNIPELTISNALGTLSITNVLIEQKDYLEPFKEWAKEHE